MASRSIQPFLHSSRQSVIGYISATWRMPLKLCTLAPADEYNWTCASFGPPESITQRANLSVHLFLYSLRQKVPILYNGQPFPQNCPFSWGSGSPSIHDSLGESEPIVQTASRSVQPFLHRWPQSVPLLYNGPLLPPQNCLFPWRIWTPIEYLVPWAHPSPQPKWHLDRFSSFCRAD